MQAFFQFKQEKGHYIFTRRITKITVKHTYENILDLPALASGKADISLQLSSRNLSHLKPSLYSRFN